MRSILLLLLVLGILLAYGSHFAWLWKSRRMAALPRFPTAPLRAGVRTEPERRCFLGPIHLDLPGSMVVNRFHYAYDPMIQFFVAGEGRSALITVVRGAQLSWDERFADESKVSLPRMR